MQSQRARARHNLYSGTPWHSQTARTTYGVNGAIPLHIGGISESPLRDGHLSVYIRLIQYSRVIRIWVSDAVLST
jgi:hypothetical protein